MARDVDEMACIEEKARHSRWLDAGKPSFAEESRKQQTLGQAISKHCKTYQQRREKLR